MVLKIKMSLKCAKSLGLALFCIRMSICVVLIGMQLYLDPNDLWDLNMISSQGISWPFILALMLGLGAFTDIILVFGAWKKNIGAIWFWNVSQIFLGGILFCIMNPLVTLKAIDEIKEERKAKESNNNG